MLGLKSGLGFSSSEIKVLARPDTYSGRLKLFSLIRRYVSCIESVSKGGLPINNVYLHVEEKHIMILSKVGKG